MLEAQKLIVDLQGTPSSPFNGIQSGTRPEPPMEAGQPTYEVLRSS